MSFHDTPFELAEDRIDDLRREADVYRRASEARRGRRLRARLRRSLRRRAAAHHIATIARAANSAIGALISPSWPTRDGSHGTVPVRHAR